MPFVTPKGSNTTTTSGAAGRSNFRPPWVKDDVSTPKTPTVPWAKKTTTTAAAKAEKENGEKSSPSGKTATATVSKKDTTDSPANKKPNESTAAAKKVETAKKVEPAKKIEPLKKLAEPAAKKVPEPLKKTPIAAAKKAPEPVKKATTPVGRTTVPSKTSAAAAKKKEPTPSSSEEEETDEEEEEEEETEEESEEESEEEEETEEESEEESEEEEKDNKKKSSPYKIGLTKEQEALLKLKPITPQKPKEEESELKRRFSIEKPKLRPVTVKRDKSMKKIEDDADDDRVEGETDEERERRLRFKLEKPTLRHVKREEKPLPCKSTDNILKIRPQLKKVPKVDEILKEPKEDPKPEFKTKTLRKTPSIKREPSIKNVPAPPPLPSLVPKAPPPPPPPGGLGSEKPLSEKQKAVLDKLKTRPRRRPDWSEMMKEVEQGRKLRHVQCNDRSQPILVCKSMTKVDDKFIFETEKDNSHNKLLQQIQGGIKLRPTKTNDRSKPILEGLRKFRRQMTIEEQLQKSQSKINMLAEITPGAAGTANTSARGSIASAISIEDVTDDELDDIDKLRDDLQSTKQMLALELRNREAQERENKKLLAQIARLEAELEREKSREKNLEYGSNVIIATMETTPVAEDAYVKSLKDEAESARKQAKELEKKYHSTGELLDQAKSELEEQKQQIKMLERKLAQALQGNVTPESPIRPQFNFCYSYEDPDDHDTYYSHATTNGEKGGGSLNGSRRPSEAHMGRDSSPDLDFELSESDPDEPEEKKAERREKRLAKEVKVLRNKLTKVKVKEEAAKKEKQVLKQAIKKNHVLLKEENKKFKKLEKEVHKMAASMKLDEEDEDGDEDGEDKEEQDEEQESEAEESEEESEDSESEESEPETESESEAEDASSADKKNNLEPRVKKHENRLAAMKKCNVLLQATVDNSQDEITQVRAKAANLQAELDSVLADLGF